MNIDISYHYDVETRWPYLVQEFPCPQQCLLPILFTSPSCTKKTTHRDGSESSDVMRGGDLRTRLSYVIRFPQLLLILPWGHCPRWHRKICDLKLPRRHRHSSQHQSGRTPPCKWVPHNLRESFFFFTRQCFCRMWAATAARRYWPVLELVLYLLIPFGYL